MLKTFLKPGWVLLLLFVVAFSYLAFTVLAPWQLGKDDDIVERNELITHAYEADPQPVEDLVDGNGAIKDDEWSRATLHGQYLPQDEVLLRLRPVDSGPSYQSLVPFRTDSGLTILVNRGWVKAGEANAVPDIPAAPSGETTLTGMIRADEAEHQSAPIKQEGYQQVYSIHTEQIATLIDAPLAHDYIQLSADQPGVLNPCLSRSSTAATTSPTATNGLPSASWPRWAWATSCGPKSVSAAACARRKQPSPPSMPMPQLHPSPRTPPVQAPHR